MRGRRTDKRGSPDNSLAHIIWLRRNPGKPKPKLNFAEALSGQGRLDCSFSSLVRKKKINRYISATIACFNFRLSAACKPIIFSLNSLLKFRLLDLANNFGGLVGFSDFTVMSGKISDYRLLQKLHEIK